MAMLNDVNSGLDFEKVFDKYFHPDNFRAWLATNILMNSTDTSSQNFYLYKPSASSRFHFTPWDYDGAWDWNHQGGTTNVQSRAMEGISNWWGMILARRYIETKGEVDKLTAKINELRGSVLSDASIKGAMGQMPMTGVDAILKAEPDQSFLDPSFAAHQAEVARLPATVDTALNEYAVSLKRPMPLYQDASKADASSPVTLSWDPSYSISGNPLVYDVVLATSPETSTSDTNCTKDDTPVAQLSTGIVLTQAAVSDVQLVPSPALTAGQYYLQVIARDKTTGYCQLAYDTTTTNPADPSTTHFGVYAFKYDGTTITYDGD